MQDQGTTVESQQLSIDQYAVIGNMKTSCFVGIDGSIDWCCFPFFNSPSVFAKILDCEKGGYFSIKPNSIDYIPKQHYWPDSNVLVTKFLMDEGVGQVVDFMPLRSREDYHLSQSAVFSKQSTQETEHMTVKPKSLTDAIVRRLEVVHGALHFTLECFPAFNYAKDSHLVKMNSEGTRAVFKSEKLCLELLSSIPCLKISNSGVVGKFCLNSNVPNEKTCTFVLRPVEASAFDDLDVAPSSKWYPNWVSFTENALIDTIAYWQNWVSKISYQGRWRERVCRSALTMKLMTFEPTGAIISSPSTSLPKVIGGARNYDYRFTWIRDACFALEAFLKLGCFNEATQLMNFLERICTVKKSAAAASNKQANDGEYTAQSLGAPLSVMYNIDGSSKSVEEHAESLDHLKGYKNSRPVRVGNAASTHLEFDIYGELLDVVYKFDQKAAPISYEFWNHLRAMVNWVCDHWSKPDASIWEVRGVNQHYVHSKVMCWVALDRAIKLSIHRSFPSDRERWLQVRDAIFEDVMKKGWNEEVGSFVQCYGSKTLDVSLLVLPVVDFLSPHDPKILSTINAINRSPRNGGLVSSTLVYRYDTSAVGSHEGRKEGTFNMCSMWLIQALTLAGKTDGKLLHQAQLLFEQMLTYSNRVGLYSEQTSFSGQSLGNFPHCNTHSALINTAITLNNMMD
jgi:GH15 family glucan-1,4-alpha-glucosidase